MAVERAGQPIKETRVEINAIHVGTRSRDLMLRGRDFMQSSAIPLPRLYRYQAG